MNKHLLLLTALIISISAINAQDNTSGINFINIESGVNLSQFDFSDSETETAFKNGDYSPSQHQAISLGFDLTNRLNILVGASYDKHQLIAKAIDMNDSHLSYDINYVSTGVGLEYQYPLQERVGFLVNGGLAYNYLLSGFQHLGSATYDLKDTDFQKNSYSYIIGGGLLYQCTNTIGVILRYDYKNTADMTEKDPIDTYTISSYAYSLALRFRINN